ncbi:MAG: DUF4097 family beta strand repeat-containing protein, partial [Sciscionella sp.]
AELALSIGAGRLRVRLSDEPGVHIEVRHDPTAGNAWTQGISGLMSWVSQQFGRNRFGQGGFGSGFGAGSFGQGGSEPGAFGLGNVDWSSLGQGWQDDVPAGAVRQAKVEQSGRRIVVRTSQAPPLKLVPLAVTVQAPSGSQLDLRSGTAEVTVTGRAGQVQLDCGTGDVTVDHADGRVDVHTGSGAVRLGPMLAGLKARSGSGDIEVSSVGDTASVVTASGDVWLGAVQADVTVRTGAGDLTVADASRGQLALVTGSGKITVGVHAGITAAVELVSHSGSARSELPISDQPPEEPEQLRIRGRTGSGTVVVRAAAC